jgi:hypothetical protein
MLPLSLDCP